MRKNLRLRVYYTVNYKFFDYCPWAVMTHLFPALMCGVPNALGVHCTVMVCKLLCATCSGKVPEVIVKSEGFAPVNAVASVPPLS